MTKEQENKLADQMLNAAREETIKHLLSNKANEFKSGYLEIWDVFNIQSKTYKRIECSSESGEYFYRLVK